MAKQSSRRVLVASAAAGLFMAASLGAPSVAHAEEVPCYGINKCKGTGECGGKEHSCAGENECAGKGWIKIEKEKCLKIKDGRLTPEEK